MLRANLSTGPFYNDRAVRVWIAVLVGLVAGATVVNVSRILGYSRSDTELALQASRDEARSTELRQAASSLRASVDTAQIAAASVEAKLANDLIDRRTFSWTALFNTFESTLPANVRITAVRPVVGDDGHVALAISVVARGVDDVDAFMESVESTGAFRNLLSREEFVDESGQLVAAIETTYLPAAPAAEASPGPAVQAPATPSSDRAPERGRGPGTEATGAEQTPPPPSREPGPASRDGSRR
jgi:Tfp pilus assembly protein PilN